MTYKQALTNCFAWFSILILLLSIFIGIKIYSDNLKGYVNQETRYSYCDTNVEYFYTYTWYHNELVNLERDRLPVSDSIKEVRVEQGNEIIKVLSHE